MRSKQLRWDGQPRYRPPAKQRARDAIGFVVWITVNLAWLIGLPYLLWFR